jgi:hypothetical protein
LSCKVYFEGKVQLRHSDNITPPLFPDPNNGPAFVPESETSLAGSVKWPGLKMADKKGGKMCTILLKKVLVQP